MEILFWLSSLTLREQTVSLQEPVLRLLRVWLYLLIAPCKQCI